MRSVIAGAAVLAMTVSAAAAGWRVEVDDSHGFRVAALLGESADSDHYGIAIMCGGDINQIVFRSAPTGDFSVKPGHRTAIMAGSTELAKVRVDRNDSAGVRAVGDIENIHVLLEALSRDGAKFELDGIAGAEVDIPGEGLVDALSLLESACP